MTPPPMAGWNLALRFGLELAAIAGLAVAAWRLADGPVRWIAVVVVPAAAAVVWTTFNVPDDPSRSGEAPVVVPGSIRLAIELAVLAGGAAAVGLVGRRELGLALGALVIFHYAVSLPRINWLLQS